ncbi:hypothetical protein ACFLXG_04900 [Chloroflexota bacterium]
MNDRELYHWLKDKHPQLVKNVIFTTGDVIGRDTTRSVGQTTGLFLSKSFTNDELRTIMREAVMRKASKEVEK